MSPERTRIAGLVLIALASCSSSSAYRLPDPPTRPTARVQPVAEAVAEATPEPRGSWTAQPPPALVNATIAVLDFQEGVDPPAAADGLRQRFASGDGPRLLDPAQVAATMTELDLDGLTAATIAARARTAGRLDGTDYLLFGSVAHTTTEVPLRAEFEDGALERYEEEYADYADALGVLQNEVGEYWVYGADQGLGAFDQDLEKARIVDLLADTPSPEELRSGAAGRAADVTKVAVDAVLLDFRTGETVWSYRWDRLTANPAEGLDPVLDDLVGRLRTDG